MTREQFRPDDHPNDHFLLTTHVGSYPKPTWLDRAQELVDDPDAPFDEEALAEAEDDAARLMVEEHERTGADVVVDGEMRRTEMIEYFAERIDGYDFPGKVKVWGHNYFDKPRVVEEVSYDQQWVVDEYRFAESVAESPVKTCLTGPYTLANFSFDEVYGDPEDLAYELADLANQELQALVDAGARYIQIDEPGLGTTPEDHAIVGNCLEQITADLPDDVRVGLHVCYGDYSRIYPEVLDYPIDELDIEMVNDGFGQLDTFRDPEFTLDAAFGVVDAHDGDVESVEEIKRNIRKGLEVVPPEQLVVSPDCGLKLLPREVAYRKTENMVKAAREVEAELDEER